MAYRITYSAESGKYEPIKERTAFRVQILIAACLLAFSLTVKYTWNEGIAVLRDYLIPGEPSVTLQAYEQWIRDLQDGQPLQDSLMVFGRQLLNAEEP